MGATSANDDVKPAPPPRSDERIAVIGSGMAGLAAAWALRRAGRRVTLYERLPVRGMDAHTARIGHGGSVDAPLRVMSPAAWTALFTLCAHLGVGTFEVDTGLSFSARDGDGAGDTWLSTARRKLGPLSLPPAGALTFVRRRNVRLALDLVRLARETRRGLPDVAPATALGAHLAARGYSPELAAQFLLPVLSTICTCDDDVLRAWPAAPLLSLFHTIMYGPRSHRVAGGVSALVERLLGAAAPHPLELRAGAAVDGVRPEADGVVVHDAAGAARFDRVVVATQANHTAFLDASACAAERAVLARFPYVRGELLTHGDARMMPRDRRHWAPLNFLLDDARARAAGGASNASMWTVWLNPVEPSLAGQADAFQSWSPLFPPEPRSVVAAVRLERAIVSPDSQRALTTLTELHAEPSRRLFFVGSYAAPGVPLLESAVRSALAVAARLGAPPPFDVPARA